MTEAGAIDPVIKATVMLSESGFASIQDVVAFGEIKDDSIAGKLKGLFGVGSSSSVDTESEKETVVRSETSSGSAASESSTPSPSDVPEKKEKPKDTISLELEVRLSSLPPMTVAEKRTARER